MSLRIYLQVSTPSSLKRRVEGSMIILTSGCKSVRVPLKAWNITGLDTTVE